MRYQGRMTSWKDDQGYGFISPNGGGAHVFVHINSFSNRHRRPASDELVTYELKVDAKGRAQAGSVAFVGEHATPTNSSGYSSIPSLFACGFLVFVAAAAFAGKLPEEVFVLYLAASVVAFFAYAFDKLAAQKNRWRTQENTLHLFAFIGGWPGALVAQRLLRHKSKKTSFQTVFWGTVFLNCGVLGWLFTPSGATTLRSFLSAA